AREAESEERNRRERATHSFPDRPALPPPRPSNEGRIVGVRTLLAAALLSLSSPSFHPGGQIPRRFPCDGAGGSPPLRWSAPPAPAPRPRASRVRSARRESSRTPISSAPTGAVDGGRREEP